MGLALLSSLIDKKKEKNLKKPPVYLMKCREPRLILKGNHYIEEPTVLYYPEEDYYDCIICDDSQRYQEFFYNHNKEKTIPTIINKAYVSVFFIDEKQRVHSKDYIELEKITTIAEKNKADIYGPYDLTEQYRIKCADHVDIPFLDIVDNLLPEDDNPGNITRDIKEFGGYEFALADSPSILFSRIRRKNKIRQDKGYTSRVVAGKGKSKKTNTDKRKSDWTWLVGTFGTIVPLEDGPEYKTWKYGDKEWKDKEFTFVTGQGNNGEKPVDADGKQVDAVNYVGCIDFCQGTNLEYVGVILAPDLVYEKDCIKVKPANHANGDWNFQGNLDSEEKKKRIKNTYRVLLTRGERGCYIFCCNKELQNHLAGRDKSNQTCSEFSLPLLKRGSISRIIQDRKNNKIIRAYISCGLDANNQTERYVVSSQTVKQMYEEFKNYNKIYKKRKSVKRILKKDNMVTFIAKTKTFKDEKIINYATSVELDYPLPKKFEQKVKKTSVPL